LDNASAQKCIGDFLTAEDDCDPDAIVPTVAISGTCDGSLATISASDRCGNSVSETIDLFIDTEDPVADCGLLDALSTDDFLITNQRAPKMVDVGLVYTASDSCGQPLQVDVQLFSDEIVVDKLETSLLYEHEDSAGNLNYGLLIRSDTGTTCNSVQSNCVADQNPDGRVYTVKIIATDSAGRVSAPAVCKVLVQRTPNRPVVDSGDLWRLFDLNNEWTQPVAPTSRRLSDAESVSFRGKST
jgi:hypothetical protein